MDAENEQRIWQRVLQPGCVGADIPETLLHEARRQLESYRQLGNPELIRRQEKICACLRGIYALRGQRLAAGSRQRKATVSARQSFSRSCQAAREYAALAAVPEVGFLFSELSRMEQSNGFALACLLGREEQ